MKLRIAVAPALKSAPQDTLGRLRRMGAGAFAFFLIKGCVWLAAAFWVAS